MRNNYMKGHGETLSPVPERLLNDLEDCFPLRDFGPKSEMSEIMYHYGQRSVINFLKHHVKMQQDNILNTEDI